MTSDRRLRFPLSLAAVGAVAVLLGFLGTAAGIAGMLAVIAGAVLAAPWAQRAPAPAARWWSLLTAGTGLLVLAVPLRIVLETPGGLLAAIGGGLVIVAVALGFPVEEN